MEKISLEKATIREERFGDSGELRKYSSGKFVINNENLMNQMSHFGNRKARYSLTSPTVKKVIDANRMFVYFSPFLRSQ